MMRFLSVLNRCKVAPGKLTGVLDLLYPRRCFLCGELSGDSLEFEGYLCNTCAASLREYPETVCAHCGAPVPDAGYIHRERCVCCEGETQAFKGLVSIGRYGDTGALREVILALKHGKRMELAWNLGALLADEISRRFSGKTFDGAVPVPIHASRLRKRGFNQSALIARALARRMDIPHYPWMLKRVRKTDPQHGGIDERRKNVHNAFQTGGTCLNAALLLVDDVFTTGSTVRECIKTLEQAGAREVVAATCAWVPRHENSEV